MTDLPAQPLTFNLWHDPWIRVVRPEGNLEELSIAACLMRAAEFHALYDPSPLTVGGVHRLLAAILQWAYNPRDLADLVALLDAGQFDPARLDAFAAHYADRFDLFHPTLPFLQTGDVPLSGPALVETPSKRGRQSSATNKGTVDVKGVTWITRLVTERPSGN